METPFRARVGVLFASYIIRIHVMWRQAPITAAVVIAGSLSARSEVGGIESGLRRVMEVIFGCVVALAVSWIMAKFWPVAVPLPVPKVTNPIDK
jgi:uncharacterized membrane protein YccC